MCELIIHNGKCKLGRVKGKYGEKEENRGKIAKGDSRLNTLTKVFNEKYNVLDHEKYKNEKCITGPIEYSPQTFFANINNHISMNFDKFQNKYL